MRVLASCLAGLWLLSCDGSQQDETPDTDDADADTDTDGDSDTDPDTDGDTDDTDTTVISDYGLDVRPPNPTCLAPDRPIENDSARLVAAYPALEFTEAMMLAMAPGDTARWWVPTQEGVIYRFDDDESVTTAEVMLDLRDRVDDSDNEMGLLSIAFHPDFANNGELYVYYSADKAGVNHEQRISLFVFDHVNQTFDPGGESFVLRIDWPNGNHDGGTILFGPDGFLYLGTGDGGGAGDTDDTAQDLFELTGKMLRIDVDGADPYGIPADNPYADGLSGRPEIYAHGLRNPVRFTFDDATGDLWVGDVGQGAWEEIDLVELGGNYGWNIREGFECYAAANCPFAGLVPPVIVYPTTGSSVIAGEVYHGTAITGLQGVLLYNDYYDGDIIGLFYDDITGEPAPATVVAGSRNIVHYAVHPLTNELYLTEHGYPDGFWKLEPPVDQVPDPFPATLSATGCFDAVDPTVPLEMMIPYGVAPPFWSAGATKTRWFAIPDGTTIDVDTDGDWELPIGTVIAKEFTDTGERLETRLFVRHDDGEWAGYAYAWRSDGTDADLLYGGLTIDAPSGDWLVPDRNDCISCHTEVAGGSLGFETWQLNTLHDYPSTGRIANQLATLDHIGMFTAAIGDPTTLPVLPAIEDDENYSSEDRVRAYLHVNCAMCHQPDGTSRTDTDFRYDTPLDMTGLCDAPIHGSFGIDDAMLIVPGGPLESIVAVRMNQRGAYQMPPLATLDIDIVGVGVFHSWIAGLATCP